MKHTSLAVSMLLALAMPLAITAQKADHLLPARHLQPNEHLTNLPNTTTFDAPPAGFDPITASDADLAYHGFPPRPDQAADSKAYATWTRAMKASKIRINPTLEQTEVFHGPVKPGKLANPTAVESNAVAPGKASNTAYSYNWSGYVDFSGATKYGSTSYYFVVNDFVVPVAEQAFGACTNGWDYGSAWNGIDGWGSGDVLQAGIEFDAYCYNYILFKSYSTYYSAWYEWFPNGSVRISNLPIAPGDDMFVEVWHTSATQGYAYLVNYNNNQSVTVAFTAPYGTSLVGNSAEWVVERPSVGGSAATLPNYIMEPFWDAYAYTESYAFNDIDEATPVDMLDNSGGVISYPEYLGVESFVMHDTGSAW